MRFEASRDGGGGVESAYINQENHLTHQSLRLSPINFDKRWIDFSNYIKKNYYSRKGRRGWRGGEGGRSFGGCWERGGINGKEN